MISFWSSVQEVGVVQESSKHAHSPEVHHFLDGLGPEALRQIIQEQKLSDVWEGLDYLATEDRVVAKGPNSPKNNPVAQNSRICTASDLGCLQSSICILGN